MTAVTPHRRRTVAEPKGNELPTLFRIPTIGGTPALSQNEPDAVTDPDVIPDQPEPRESPSDSAYRELPELPPIDEPAGRTWAESVGSRAVIVLLFLAVLTVAVLGTRDIPPISGSRDLADPVNEDPRSHIAQLPADVMEQDDVSSTTSIATQEVQLDAPEPNLQSSEPIATEQDANAHQQINPSLPLPDLREQSPNESTLPGLPELANTEPNPSIDLSSVLDQADLGEENPSVVIPNIEPSPIHENPLAATESIDVNDQLPPEDSAEEALATAVLEKPVYKVTSTPEAVEDWSRYYQQNRTVGYQDAGQNLQFRPDAYPSNPAPRTTGQFAPGGSVAMPNVPQPMTPATIIHPNQPAGPLGFPPYHPQGIQQWPAHNPQGPNVSAPYQPQSAPYMPQSVPMTGHQQPGMISQPYGQPTSLSHPQSSGVPHQPTSVQPANGLMMPPGVPRLP